MAIDENEIDLIKICFKVKDNVQEKRLVFIDTQADSTQILYAYANQNRRYITNGVTMNENSPDNSQIDKNDNSNKNENQQQSDTEQFDSYESKDNTAPKILPQTGEGITMVLVIAIVIVISIVLRIKLKKQKG